MHAFEWSQVAVRRRNVRIDPERVVYVISDLHLGDGTFSDTFAAKDKYLLDFLKKVEDEDATLVVAGDAVDFSQAWFFTKILRAHGKVLGAFSALAAKDRLFYVLGNHDHDLQFYTDMLRIPVVHGVEIGQKTLILHGYEFDPVIGVDIDGSEWRTKMHHLVERLLKTWIRLPLQHFYTRWNRLSFWCFHKAIFFKRLQAELTDKLLGGDRLAAVEAQIRYWMLGQVGDPGGIWKQARHAVETGPYELVVSGHSHLPGIVNLPGGRRYANTGSWTFRSATVLRIEGELVQLRDWISGREWSDELYQPLLRGDFDNLTFDDWWEQNYMGWLRYRVAEPTPESAQSRKAK